MKKILILSITLILLAAIAVTGTLAFYTDEESEVNVMTVGKVRIDQLEKDGEGKDFKQDQPLRPVVNYTDPKADENYVDKVVTVENIGQNPAYVRTLIAVPFFDCKDVNVLHWDRNTNGWTWNDGLGIVYFNGKPYQIFMATYDAALPVGAVTPTPNLTGVYLDAFVDHDETLGYFCWVDGKKVPIENFTPGEVVKVHVLSQGVQSEGFATPAEAFAASFDNGAAQPDNALLAEWFKVLGENTTPGGNTPGGNEPEGQYVSVNSEAELIAAV